MLRTNPPAEISEFLWYLASQAEIEPGLPPLAELGRKLGISVATLREQLEVARALGLVEVKPRTGMRRLPYSFTPAVQQSLKYALALNDGHFQQFAEMRNHLEAAYWDEAVSKLLDEDKQILQSIIARSWEKLQGTTPQVPHEEHRKLHLLIYSRLANPFVTGILEAYWDAYEAVGLNMYTGDIDYLHTVWKYHTRMVEAICNGNVESGRQALIQHVDLLMHRKS